MLNVSFQVLNGEIGRLAAMTLGHVLGDLFAILDRGQVFEVQFFYTFSFYYYKKLL